MKRKSPLRKSKIIAGITGSVAAYKSVELIRRLRDYEADVTAVMTSASLRFITPLSVELACGKKPLTGLWDEPLAHIKTVEGASLFIIAPATASTIAKLANGIADDMLPACYLAYTGKTIIAPAMNSNMYAHPAFRRNLERLEKDMGVITVGPQSGTLACGAQGPGRMAPVDEIIEAAEAALTPKTLQGKKVLITAGPTREYLDPVRFISNRSSGKMGYALAKAAVARGAQTLLVSGPCALARPQGLAGFVNAETTAEMKEAVLARAGDCHMLIMAAAPADFTPAKRSGDKLQRQGGLNLRLDPTEDILAAVSAMKGKKKKPCLIGFAAGTGPDLSMAHRKLKAKGLDMIVFNDVLREGAGFDCDTNAVVIIGGAREAESPVMHKDDIAAFILEKAIEKIWKA